MTIAAGSTTVFYENQIRELAAVITPSEESPIYPATNLVLNNCCLTFRSLTANATPVRLVIDMGAAVACDAIAMANINIRDTATVTIEANATDSWGAPTYSQTISLADYLGDPNDFQYNFAATKTFRYWRLSITDNGNPDGFIEIGELFIGTPIALTDIHDSGIPVTISPNNIEHRTEYGQAYVYERSQVKTWELNWSNVQTETRDELKAFFNAIASNARPLFLTMAGEDANQTYFCRIVSPLESSRISFDVYVIRLRFQEEAKGLILPR